MTLLELLKVIPEEQVVRDTDAGDVFGSGGKVIVFPHSEQEITSILHYAYTNRLTVSIIGGGTKRGYGGLIDKADILLSLSRMKGVVEHTAGDLTMTVRSGTTIHEINEHLSPYGQMIGLDVRWPSKATIGGVIAANDSGPKRLRYGSARDIVIGLRVVYPDGRVIRTGGKVVKNVTGYDMNKLFIGSMGTLAVISEVTFKLRPLPQSERLVLMSFPSKKMSDIDAFGRTLLASHLEPYAIEILNPTLFAAMGGDDRYALVLCFEDRETAVTAQEHWVKEHKPSGIHIEILSEDATKNWWSIFRNIAPNAHADRADDGVISIGLKIGSLSTDVIHVVKTADELAHAHHLTVHIHGGVGHGISRVYATGDSSEQITDYVHALRSHVEANNGYVVVELMPLSLRQRVDVWGKTRVADHLLKSIKKAIDPYHLLNPTRFVGGL